MVTGEEHIQSVGLREGGGGGEKLRDRAPHRAFPLGAVGGGRIGFCKASHNGKTKYQAKSIQFLARFRIQESLMR